MSDPKKQEPPEGFGTDELNKRMAAQRAGHSFAPASLLACAEFHENVGSYLVMAAMMPPTRSEFLKDMKSRSLKHYKWAREIRDLLEQAG